MDATTSPSPDARIARFSRAERWVHRSITVLMIVLIATAAGILITASAGTLRILQLRRRTRKVTRG